MTGDNTLHGPARTGGDGVPRRKIAINADTTPWYIYAAIIIFGVAAPFIFPAYTTQIALLWLMILFALTWDICGGQMGYNSLGNIFFFGAGMYISAVIQVGMFTDVGTYTSARGGEQLVLDYGDYFFSLFVGTIAAAIGCVVLAIVLGRIVFGLRGPYFAIGTLGLALAARELAGTWEWIGGGSGIAMPVYPGQPHEKSVVFYILFLLLAVLTFVFVRWLYATRFGLAINAIRDDEGKAEAMGIHTLRHKLVAWSSAAFLLGMSGAIFGNLTGFIEPLEVAFPAATFGIFMVVMALLGGKGTLWGPVIGATLFHIVKEVTWTYLLGWQWVALGLLIVINVVFFQEGIMGWMQRKWPERFGITVDQRVSADKAGEEASR
ncbi:branched-chain amino acid ABC transporter permease [Pelagibius litoralis]|uniref:Branched-chain amino acid ABC transporter permease n=1 Tax=Pelagibius litoralis TaxID=374515 RepID=A0A967C6B0_9PROT|nr:branched-chain amino acid ABC transporter permease [Pelagibius litoralis]NIA67132.1 branched-chain amino acid ABC transporter permease [Pelagibius litoralis]